MDRRRRKEILGQWGPRDADPRDAARGRALQEEIEGAATAGRPAEIRRRHFRPSVDSYVASLGGPLPYMVRLREIERMIRDTAAALEECWRALAAEHPGDAAGFAVRWLAVVQRWGFTEVNDLIERHNRWYPIEARLPMDVRRRDYVLVNGRHYRHQPLDVGWALERFPAELPATALPPLG